MARFANCFDVFDRTEKKSFFSFFGFLAIILATIVVTIFALGWIFGSRYPSTKIVLGTPENVEIKKEVVQPLSAIGARTQAMEIRRKLEQRDLNSLLDNCNKQIKSSSEKGCFDCAVPVASITMSDKDLLIALKPLSVAGYKYSIEPEAYYGRMLVISWKP